MRLSRRGSLRLLGAAGIAASVRPYRLLAAADSPLIARAAPVMGTIAEVFVRHPDHATGIAAAEAALETLRAVDRNLSHYIPDSDLGRLHGVSGAWTPVSRDFIAVFDRSRELHDATGGRFDPTCGALIRLWKEAAKAGREPSAQVLSSVVSGFGRIELDAENRRARLLDPRVRLDFGAIGKGYGAERASETLRQYGIGSGLVAVSGDIRVTGKMPVEEIAIQHPEDPQRFLAAISLDDGAISTSGDYEQGLEFAGRMRSHLVDPSSKVPVSSPPRSVSVIAPAGALADGISSAAFLLGEQDGFSFAAARGEVLVAGRETVAATPGFMRRLIREVSL